MTFSRGFQWISPPKFYEKSNTSAGWASLPQNHLLGRIRFSGCVSSHGVPICSYDKHIILYSDGLKLRMPHPFRTRCPKECRRGGKILKNPGKMQFSGTCNFTGTFLNESFVGKFCENLQRNMRLSATHRMPPAKSPGRSMSNIWSPYFQNTRYTWGFMYFVQPT